MVAIVRPPATALLAALLLALGALTFRLYLGSLDLLLNPSKILLEDKDHSPTTCPDYFRWIYEDLRPWRETGITREMVISARERADFRLVIVGGKAYVERYRKAFQTRDNFTQWGILQLLNRYPGKLPDLDLMFDCGDIPVINKQMPPPLPPLFRYCSNDSMSEILFPDWSFWGWAEIRVKPWEVLSKELQQGNKRRRWMEREPYAYWKGNPVTNTRWKLLHYCNVTDKHDWGARVYFQDWLKEMKEDFKHSNLADQCVHRYKIYAEGRSWSVSEKYILACDSVTLFLNPKYYDFFSRSLMPLQHYWPINPNDKCRAIKHAVDWGNTHQQEAQAIGKAGSDFVLNEMKMEYVYDYMFHVLNEYAKLLKYKPTVPRDAVEIRSESMVRHEQGRVKKYMTDSMVKEAALSNPCTMPPPYDPASLDSVFQEKGKRIRQVDDWVNEYFPRS